MEKARALTFSYVNGSQEIICATDALTQIGDSLDKLGTERAMVICGPTILKSCNVV